MVTVEDHAVEGGFGSAFIEAAVAASLPTGQVRRLGHPADKMIGFKSREAQLAEAGIDAAGIVRTLRPLLAAETVLRREIAEPAALS